MGCQSEPVQIHLQANDIMRPAAKEYFRDTTDYTKRLGLAASLHSLALLRGTHITAGNSQGSIRS